MLEDKNNIVHIQELNVKYLETKKKLLRKIIYCTHQNCKNTCQKDIKRENEKVEKIIDGCIEFLKIATVNIS